MTLPALPVPREGATPPVTFAGATIERLESAIAASKSPATRRAYRSAWTAWTAWAGEHGLETLPAEPEHVAMFLAQRAEDGASMSTLRMATAAIGAAHDLAGEPNPCADRIVRTALAGLSRQAAGQGARQAKPLTAGAVAQIRGALGAKADTHRRTARDMALISVMSDAGLRVGEAEALEWRDIERTEDGSGRVNIRQSKTDQTGEGAVVAITPAAAEDLARLERLSGFPGPDAPVFRLGARQIARRIEAVAAAAGLGAGYSGHSGRVGMAIRMTRAGAPAQAVMRQGRWQSPAMVARYTRHETAAEALRYL